MNFNLNFNGRIKHTKTDFVIVSQTGLKIPCHKFVLAEMSPVFDTMFGMEDSQEVLNGRIEIKDVSDEALEAMVEFMYSQKLQLDIDIYTDLLILCNKYDLKILAEKLVPKFIENIDIDNCVNAYFFGILHEFETVKNSALGIILFNWDILQVDELSKSNPKEYASLKKEISNFFQVPKHFIVNKFDQTAKCKLCPHHTFVSPASVKLHVRFAHHIDEEHLNDKISVDLSQKTEPEIDFNQAIDIKNCTDAYACGFRNGFSKLKFAAFRFILNHSEKNETLLKKMSETHSKAYKLYCFEKNAHKKAHQFDIINNIQGPHLLMCK